MKRLTDVRDLPDKDYDAWFKRLRDDRYEKLLTDWSWWRREDQQPPAGDWHVWMLLAGRGFGKTRTGAEWVREFAEATPGARIALVAASLHEARQVMVEGESGLLAIAPDARRPDYESSLRRLPASRNRHRMCGRRRSRRLRRAGAPTAWSPKVITGAKWS